MKIREFQFKILNNVICNNCILYFLGKRDNNHCTFCELFIEKTDHLFFTCTFISQFWKKVMNWWFDLTGENIYLEIKEVLFGIMESRTSYCLLLNIIILYGKFFVYKSRLNNVKPNFPYFVTEIKDVYNKEKTIAEQKGTQQYDRFQQMWRPCIQVF